MLSVCDTEILKQSINQSATIRFSCSRAFCWCLIRLCCYFLIDLIVMSLLPGSGGGGVHWLGRILFLVQNFKFNTVWGFQKNDFMGGMEIVVDIFGVTSKSNIFMGNFYKSNTRTCIM